MAHANVVGLDVLAAKVKRLSNPNPRVLMKQWESILAEDTRRGVLAGTDKDGKPAPALRYRPKTATPEHWSAKHQKAFQHHKVFTGIFSETAYNNLSKAEYQRLNGTRLAPRGPNSRVIANLYTAQGYDGAKRWRVIGAWAGVVSAKGKQFLLCHFNGEKCGKGHRVTMPR